MKSVLDVAQDDAASVPWGGRLELRFANQTDGLERFPHEAKFL